MHLKERAQRLKTDIPAVFLALGKKETPLTARLFAAITIAYALSPIDLIPDFIPVLGYLDDLIILPALVALTIRFIPEEVISRCRKESQNLWENGRPKKWYYALPVIIIWAILLFIIIKTFIMIPLT